MEYVCHHGLEIVDLKKELAAQAKELADKDSQIVAQAIEIDAAHSVIDELKADQMDWVDNLRAADQARIAELYTQLDALLNHCDKEGGECSECSSIICPQKDEMHFHHDGCPSCEKAPYSKPPSEALARAKLKAIEAFVKSLDMNSFILDQTEVVKASDIQIELDSLRKEMK